jgi:hypothetical protein
MAIAKEAGEYVLRRLLDDPFSTRATRADRFASVSVPVPAATLKLRRVGFLISVPEPIIVPEVGASDRYYRITQ